MMRLFGYALILCLLSSTQSALQAANLVSKLDLNLSEARPKVRLGQGFHSVGGLPYSQDMANCVSVKTLRPLAGAQSESLSVYINNIASQAEYVSLLTKNLSADLSFSPLGTSAEKINPFAASIKGCQTLTEGLHYEENYNYLYIEVRKSFETEMFDAFEVKPEVLLYFKDRPQEFFGKCGDRFVSGYRKGAEVIGILQCEAQSLEEKKKMDQELKIAAGYRGLDAHGEISTLIESMQKSSSKSCKLRVTAQGGDSAFILVDTDKFLLNAFSYVNSAKAENTKPIEFATTSYNVVLDPTFSSEILNKIDLKLSDQKVFVASKDEEIETYVSILSIAATQGLNFQSVIDNARQRIETLEKGKNVCLQNIFDSSACKDAPSKFRLPLHTILK